MINKKNQAKKILELTAKIVLQSAKGIQIPETSAKIVLNKESFSIFLENSETYLFSYREIINLTFVDFQLKLSLDQEKELIISQLGYQFEDFIRIFIKLRNEALLQDLLFQETLKKSGLEADFSFFDKAGVEKQKGRAEFKFYQTSLVILPESGELARIFFSDIQESKIDDFQIIFELESGEKLVISKLGEEFDLFKETLQGCLNEIFLNIQSFIKGIWSEIDFSTLNKISKLMKEGKAVKRKNLEIISSEFWQRLEKKIRQTAIKEEYEFLQTIGEKDEIYIGFKKGLMGGLSGDYFWFFIPIYGEKAKFGNALAFETAGEKETGRATYFFKIVSRKKYAKIKDRAELGQKTDDLILNISRALRAINFRREPIYLPQEKLEEPEYARYKFSMAKIPEIKIMRELFIGRVVHSNNKQWQEDVKNLLEFNLKSKDDQEKWQKTKKVESEI